VLALFGSSGHEWMKRVSIPGSSFLIEHGLHHRFVVRNERSEDQAMPNERKLLHHEKGVWCKVFDANTKQGTSVEAAAKALLHFFDEHGLPPSDDGELLIQPMRDFTDGKLDIDAFTAKLSLFYEVD
jgi:hypothetical protein